MRLVVVVVVVDQTQGVRMEDERIEAAKNWPEPTSVRDMCSSALPISIDVASGLNRRQYKTFRCSSALPISIDVSSEAPAG